jgi:hypothetical protein
MNERERLHRSEPERTGPIRDFSGLYRRRNGSADAAGAKIDPPLGKVSSGDGTAPRPQSVEAAYRLIQKHVDERRRAAAEFSHSSSVRNTVSDPLQQLLDRVVNLQGEMLPLLLDVMRSLMQPPAQAQADIQSPRPAANPDGVRQTLSLIVDVVCRRPVEIAFDLREHLIYSPLATPGLHSLDGDKPALRNVNFIPPNDDGSILLQIVVPDNQMSGAYSGVIVNQITAKVCGTVSVKVRD